VEEYAFAQEGEAGAAVHLAHKQHAGTARPAGSTRPNPATEITRCHRSQNSRKSPTCEPEPRLLFAAAGHAGMDFSGIIQMLRGKA